VLPLGRGAWLAGCGVVNIPWPRFLAVDLLALLVHVALWSGLGWWMAGDLELLATSAEAGKLLGMWTVVLVLTTIAGVVLWRRRSAWQPATIRAFRQAGRQLRGLARRS
jgi:membrane protein DedA with SNARE-associated domain